MGEHLAPGIRIPHPVIRTRLRGLGLATINRKLSQADNSSSDDGQQLAYNPAATNLLDTILQRRSKGGGGGGNSCPGDRGPGIERGLR
ncbi:hypothetical protein CCC_00212 [Paramagnetospirillum magnetotacticum MS-1]|uniref:Uncharacterized protein n=1 Tax=Paramagnetospirillum magnetotacticum MS-1 TaxID=272627 RepID=A0A0C2UWH3_PARME|nr:hypothetical protein [Paramagnetospirillum magnetotacticum]KIL97151.1 hypothetical protein CCC_00212 [Paramagnetospirillum magnetotacticum MS-1]